MQCTRWQQHCGTEQSTNHHLASLDSVHALKQHEMRVPQDSEQLSASLASLQAELAQVHRESSALREEAASASQHATEAGAELERAQEKLANLERTRNQLQLALRQAQTQARAVPPDLVRTFFRLVWVSKGWRLGGRDGERERGGGACVFVC